MPSRRQSTPSTPARRKTLLGEFCVMVRSVWVLILVLDCATRRTLTWVSRTAPSASSTKKGGRPCTGLGGLPCWLLSPVRPRRPVNTRALWSGRIDSRESLHISVVSGSSSVYRFTLYLSSCITHVYITLVFDDSSVFEFHVAFWTIDLALILRRSALRYL